MSDRHCVLLTDSDAAINSRTEVITPASFDLDPQPDWSISKRTLCGGKQEGVEIIAIDNGLMTIDLVATRGLNVLQVVRGDAKLGWDSPVREVIHPQWINLTSRDGCGWLEGFNEFIARCGLEFCGAPGVDRWTSPTGAPVELPCTLHGRIANLPASRVEVLIDQEPPHTLRVRGTVYERSMFGPNLRLVAEVATEPGSDSFVVTDEVTNLSARKQEFALLYHNNYGRPLLEEGARVHLPARAVAPINDHSAKAIATYDKFDGPQEGFCEQVYLCQLYADQQRQTSVLLQNAHGDSGASIAWSLDELPYFTLWKNTGAVAGGYVTGLEPAVVYPFNRQVEREAGRLPTLASGQTRRFTTKHTLHNDAESVAAAKKRIDAIRAGRQPEFVDDPPAP